MDRTTGLGYILDANGHRIFVDQDLPNGVGGADVDALWLTGAQEEIVSFVEAMKLVPNANDNTQLRQAVEAVVAIEAAARIAADAAEATTREAADAAEATARFNADAAEATEREAADAAEATARSNADAAEATEREAADAAEATARVNADTAEATARTTADTAEQTARTAADQALQADYIARDATVLSEAETYANGTLNTDTKLCPGGFIIKYGNAGTTTGSQDHIAFPAPFPNACFAVLCSEAAAQPNWQTNDTPTVYGTTNASKDGFDVTAMKFAAGAWAYNAPSGFFYVAFGR